MHNARFRQHARLALCLRFVKCSDHKPSGAIPASLSHASLHTTLIGSAANECSDTFGELTHTLPISAAHGHQKCSAWAAFVHRCPAMLRLVVVPQSHAVRPNVLHLKQKGVICYGSCA